MNATKKTIKISILLNLLSECFLLFAKNYENMAFSKYEIIIKLHLIQCFMQSLPQLFGFKFIQVHFQTVKATLSEVRVGFYLGEGRAKQGATAFHSSSSNET